MENTRKSIKENGFELFKNGVLKRLIDCFKKCAYNESGFFVDKRMALDA